jgi:hypothetical protein
MATLRKEVIAVGIRSAAVLTGALLATAIVALPAPARAVVAGIDVRITGLPSEFEAGANFLGVGLLLRVRSRHRPARHGRPSTPAGLHPAP